MLARLSQISLLTVLSITGCGGEKIPADVLIALQKGEKFELYSLNPDRLVEKPPGNFHGWEVLGSTKVDKADVRAKLIAALKEGAAENDGRAAGCFNPRHGIRVVHGGKTYDLVICFECLQVSIYIDDKRGTGFLVMDSPQPVFDNALREVKVKLPEQAE